MMEIDTVMLLQVQTVLPLVLLCNSWCPRWFTFAEGFRFRDFQCPLCRRASNTVVPLIPAIRVMLMHDAGHSSTDAACSLTADIAGLVSVLATDGSIPPPVHSMDRALLLNSRRRFLHKCLTSSSVEHEYRGDAATMLRAGLPMGASVLCQVRRHVVVRE